MEQAEICEDRADVAANATDSSQAPVQTTISAMQWTDLLRVKFSLLWLQYTELWQEVQRFGSWLEFEAAPVAVERNGGEIILQLEPDGTVRSLRIGVKLYDQEPCECACLWRFLSSLGIHTIRLDARLERNQIEDVVGLLYAHRGSIGTGRHMSRVVTQLMSPQGVHLACTQTTLRNGTLKVTYTYCTLRFSRMVHWFETRNKKFHDHRTLFHVAPRYAVVLTLLVIGPAMALSAILGHLVLCTILGFSGAVLFLLTYMSFMIVGSVEYDNEEKAYRLAKAYGRLKEYTNRIRADIEQARTVQEMFVPAPDMMPFRDHIRWAAGFMPAEEVGGDYFDVAELDDNRVAILFSDVSGHGMAAAFVTAIMKTTFQAWLDVKGTLEQLAQRMNANLLRLVPVGSFAAVFLAIYDRSTNRFHYANCGHQPEPWCIPGCPDRAIYSISDARNLIMGVDELSDITTSSIILESGDTVLFVSDGIVENPDVDGELYGIKRFESFLQLRRLLTPKDLVQVISDEARGYSKDSAQSDDMTILALRIQQ